MAGGAIDTIRMLGTAALGNIHFWLSPFDSTF
jgi:hypothetical protein